MLKNLFICFLFVGLFMFINSNKVMAKISTSSVFEVEVGEEKLPVYYFLEDDNGTVKERIQFSVFLKGVSATGKNYRWEHKMCYKTQGNEELCEIDFTGSDQEENAQDILSNKNYNFSFWDGDMPFYNEELVFEYVKFSNKFVCLEENCDEEITLDDIVFNENEISYAYNYDVSFDYYEDDISEECDE